MYLGLHSSTTTFQVDLKIKCDVAMKMYNSITQYNCFIPKIVNLNNVIYA